MSTSRMLGFRAAAALTIVLFASGFVKADYIQTFDNTGTSNKPYSNYGWLAYMGQNCTDISSNATATYNTCISYQDRGCGTTIGIPYTYPSKLAGNRSLLATNDSTLPAISASQISSTTISWYQWVADTGITARATVKVGDTWYVSKDAFTTSTALTVVDHYCQPQPGDLKSLTLSPSSKWYEMTVNKGVELGVGTTEVSLPTTGDLVATGLYVTGTNFFVFDNFQVTTVPEPSTIAMTAAALLGLLAYAWRKRRKN